MNYVEGLIAAVPAASKDILRQQTADAAPLFKQFGATRVVEALGDDIPRGTTTDFKAAVKATENDEIVLSWIEYPDKSARDRANEKILQDPKLRSFREAPPFDRQRSIACGFTPLVDEGQSSGMGYTDSYLLAVPAAEKQAYRTVAEKKARLFKEHGAVRVIEALVDETAQDKLADLKAAVKARADETVVMSIVEWPSKQTRDRALPKVMADSRYTADRSKFRLDEKRMIHGGFKPVLDTLVR